MKILFITATRIGDAVISTGLLNHLIAQHPGAKITVACGPLCETLFTAVPEVDRVIVLTKQRFGGHWFKLWAAVRDETWDLVVDLRRSLIPYFIPARKRYRLGPDDHRSHRVELLSGLFDLSSPAPPRIWIPEDQRAAATDLLPTGGPVIALCPTAARPEKTWPAENFAELAQSLLEDNERFPGLCLVLIGAEEDRDLLTQLASGLPPDRCAILAGCPNLQCVAAVLSSCILAVTNDSGLGHLSAATGCPTAAVFGPTRADLYRPWGMRVVVVQAPEKLGQARISGVTVAAVTKAIHSVLD